MGRERLWLILVALAGLGSGAWGAGAACKKECLKADAYYAKSCPDGLGLGEACGSDEDSEDFCATPYARCMDGTCSCLPHFQPRNGTGGNPSVCVPSGSGEAEPERDPSADICRYSNPNKEDFQSELLAEEVESSDYNKEILGRDEEACAEECSRSRKPRVKRSEKSFVLPPTVVNACRSGQMCYQLGPSAYGVCRRPTCPVGKPATTKTPCTVGDDSTCPNGFHCKLTGGQSFDLKTKVYTDATICCPSVCDKGFYRKGQCWRDSTCIAVLDNCEDRCNFAACRFMVDPCENRGMCLVPKTAPGIAPDYFWCKCAPDSGKMGRICELDGEDLNRPSASKRIKCEGSLCEPPPAYKPRPSPPLPLVKTASIPSSAFAGLSPSTAAASGLGSGFSFPSAGSASSHFFPAASAAHSSAAAASSSSSSSSSTGRGAHPITLTCRQDKDLMCSYWASIGDCTNDRQKMLAKCDCACTRLMNKQRNVRYFPVSSATFPGFNQ